MFAREGARFAGVDVDYDALADRYREAATDLVRAYETDAAFNGLAYDREDERSQVETYAAALGEPGPDTRLPAWRDAPITPAEVGEAARADLAAAMGERGGSSDAEDGASADQQPVDSAAATDPTTRGNGHHPPTDRGAETSTEDEGS